MKFFLGFEMGAGLTPFTKAIFFKSLGVQQVLNEEISDFIHNLD